MLFSAHNYFWLQWVKLLKVKKKKKARERESEQVQMDYRRGSVTVPQVLINTYVARRLTVVSRISVNASEVISLEYIWMTSLLSYQRHIVPLKGGYSLDPPRFFEPKQQALPFLTSYTVSTVVCISKELTQDVCFHDENPLEHCSS